MKHNNEEIERYRLGPFSSKADGNNGAFLIPFQSYELKVIASDGMGWDHVSISRPSRTPTWEMMCFVKDLFFGDDETVVQFHPKKSEYINNHPYCLHLWRKQSAEQELPPSIMVGVKL